MSYADKILHVGLCAGRRAKGEELSSVSQAFIRHTKEKYVEIGTGHPNLNAEVQRVVKELQPDVVFFQIQAEGIVSRKTLEVVKQNSGRSYNWTGDVREPIPKWYLDFGDCFDCTFFTNLNDVYTMRQAGFVSDYLEIGFDPEIYYPEGERDIDVVFMANNYGNFPLSGYRVQIAEKLKRTVSGFRLYGSGWKNADGNLNHSQHAEADVYRRAKIAINCSHFAYKRYASDRMLRILGSGCLCLSHYYPQIEDEWKIGREVAVFSDLADLIDKVGYYIKNEKERSRIAANGCKKAHEDFTFDSMVKNLLKW
jgi:glycosyltransferase involved in cell wall biosynthesis